MTTSQPLVPMTAGTPARSRPSPYLVTGQIEGLLRVAYATENHDRVLETLANKVSPRILRAVGTACATNLLPIAVPCHRVVRADGYIGGLEAKATLLDLESAA